MPDAPLTDPELLERLRAGRADAYEHLYATYRAPLYNLCARILGDRDEAQDVTQEVFLAAFEKLPAPGDGAPLHLRAWLYRVATNACLNRLRRRGRSAASGGERLDTVADGTDSFQRAETVALVEASLAQLNERYRTALVLKDLHGLPPAEIAAVMEVSRPAADVLVHRARTSFKAAFTRLGGARPAPASLAAVLVPFGLPAALLQAPPALLVPAPVLPAPHVAPAPVIPDVSTLAGPATVGLLGKVGAALTTKAAIGAAAAAVVIGGGAAAVRDVQHGRTGVPAVAAAAGTAGSGLGHDGARDHPGATGHDGAHRHAGAGAHRDGEHRSGGGHHTAARGSGEMHAATANEDSDRAHSAAMDDGGGTTHTATGTTPSSSMHDGGTDAPADHPGDSGMSGEHAGDMSH